MWLAAQNALTATASELFSVNSQHQSEVARIEHQLRQSAPASIALLLEEIERSIESVMQRRPDFLAAQGSMVPADPLPPPVAGDPKREASHRRRIASSRPDGASW